MLRGGPGQQPGIEPGRGAAAGEVGEVAQVVEREFGAAAGLVPGHGDRLVQGRGDVGAGQQGAHRPGQGGPAEEHHALDRLRGLRPERVQDDPVRSHRVGPEPRVGGRFGQQRQPVRAGERLGDRAGVVPCQHHGAPLRQPGRGGREIEGQRAAGRAVHAAAGLGRQPVAGRGNERVAEGQVELHRPGRGVLEGAGGGAERGLDGAPRVGAGGHVGGETDMLTEQVQLHRGLVGAGPAEFLGAVGRDHHERDGGVVGLHHRRQEIADGGPGGGEHGRGRTRGEGQAQGGEAGVALIDPDQQLDPSGGVGLGQGVGHRRGARARRHHHVAHPLEQQGRDGDPRGIQRAQLLRAQLPELTCSPASRCRAGPGPRTAGAAPGRTGRAAIPGPSPRTSAPGTGRRRT